MKKQQIDGLKVRDAWKKDEGENERFKERCFSDG